ncbi:hypothetical protein [uncultured Anaerovibrio sp.]|uniref:hypothetical protein n=1 Tax=uncultured Anaerovibrio sp. TaxID=361586 RepID=UPI00262788F6|nr:hypothetical protein [uncultured Anaerovibrio sp.]
MEAEDRGLNKGREEGKLEIAIDLFRQGAITEEVAANAAGISVEELRKAILVS